jgi:membrane-bound metal-dependent hydrolase YbcI (DUF457 family)
MIMDALGQPLTPYQLLAGTVISAGTGLLPDLDHPQSNMARALGPVTMVLSRVVNKLAGGHRRGTHSLLAMIILYFVITWLLAAYGGWAAILLVMLPVSLVTRVALAQKRVLVNVAASVPISLFLWSMAPGTEWLIPAYVLGYGLHLVGDMLTVDGVPFLWPLGGILQGIIKPLTRIPLLGALLYKLVNFFCEDTGLGLFKTGSPWENGVRYTALVALVWISVSNVLWPLAQDSHPDLFGNTAAMAKHERIQDPNKNPTYTEYAD